MVLKAQVLKLELIKFWDVVSVNRGWTLSCRGADSVLYRSKRGCVCVIKRSFGGLVAAHSVLLLRLCTAWGFTLECKHPFNPLDNVCPVWSRDRNEKHFSDIMALLETMKVTGASSTSCVRTGWDRWGSHWRGEGFEVTLGCLPVPEGATREQDRDFLPGHEGMAFRWRG